MERKLFYQYLWSAILTSLSGTLCVQIDGIIVSHLLGTEAFAAIGVLMPLVQIQLTLCLLIGIGGALRLAYSLGAKDFQTGRSIFKTTLLLLLLCSLPFMIAASQSSIVAGWFCRSEALLPLASQYGRVLLLSAPVYMLLQGSGALTRAEGFPQRVLVAVVTANCLNLCLDFVMIKVCGLGIAGAGWATTVSNAIAIGIIFRHKREHKSEEENIGEKEEGKIIGSILIAGAPVALGSVAMSLRLSYLTNATSQYLSARGMITLTVLLSIFLFVNLIIVGITQALQPLAAQYIGQNNTPALRRTCQRSLRFAALSSLCATLAVVLLAKPLCLLYGVKGEADLLVTPLRIFSLSYLFFALNYVLMVIHQTMDNRSRAMIIAVMQPLMLIPVFALMLRQTIQHIWWAFLIAESINFIIILIMSRNVLRSIFTTEKGR